MSAKFADPVKMIERGGPRLIRNEEELQLYTDELFRLTAKAKPTLAEADAIDLLSLLIEVYETKHYALPAATPVEVLRFLMEQNGLQQRDLTAELGSESNISLIMAGKRNLTLTHLRKLSGRFAVPQAVFLAASSPEKLTRRKKPVQSAVARGHQRRAVASRSL